MQIKSIVAGVAIALIAGVGSVSAGELYMADPAVTTGGPFDILVGIPTSRMSDPELEVTRGEGVGGPVRLNWTTLTNEIKMYDAAG